MLIGGFLSAQSNVNKKKKKKKKLIFFSFFFNVKPVHNTSDLTYFLCFYISLHFLILLLICVFISKPSCTYDHCFQYPEPDL